MALGLAVPACGRSANIEIRSLFSCNSVIIRLSLPFRWQRRPAGNLNLALSARRSGFVCSFSSSPIPPSSSPPSKQVDEGQAEAGDDSMMWGKVSAVLFDMDGVLCNSEHSSRMAAVNVFAEMGVTVTADDFVPFMGTGEAKFLGGVASLKGVKGFDPEKAKKRFFEIYLDKYAKPNSGIGFPGALEIIMECKRKGLKVAVASSADWLKVDANLAAAGLPKTLFDAIITADAFENLKPAPDIFLAASKNLNVPPSECLVIEDALAGVQAAKSANMRCIAVTTTLSEERLQEASPSLVRKDIGNISILDILDGGSSGSLKKENDGDVQDRGEAHFANWLQSSRRNILRYGSLGIAISCLLYTLSNWKVMQYASVKGVLNTFLGHSKTIFGNNGREPYLSKIQLKNYLSDLESRGTASTVPEFPSKLDWLNTAPLQFHRNLKGRVVLLDFWTYCCINCMHVLPDLDFLERKYYDKPFTIIGVHSAKFDNERDLEAIRNAVLRYNITHPVVNDGDMYLWRELGVSSWPTFIVVGPTGKVLAQLAGEGHRKDLDDFIDAALQFYGEKNLLKASTSIPLALEKDDDPHLLMSSLKFPGKLAVDVLSDRIFISDSNHNRIVVTDLDGKFLIQVGSSGEEALRDGSFNDACFNRPQGLAFNPKKNTLYVADTENHALREIDFVNEIVRTVAGNGTRDADYVGGAKGSSQGLNSPWDVCYDTANEKIYIAMAGQHQIWEHKILDGTTRAFSGDGFERNLNGSSSSTTSFAQPSGISLSPDSQVLYVADSESSSIRAVDLKTGGARLLAGGDPLFPDNLFKFGDHDGVASEALFQHPLGVFCDSEGQIYIADSYNHKIKKLDPVTREVVTLAGTGNAGFKDGSGLSAQLSEPSGITEAGDGKLLIADTNNSMIRCLDLKGQHPVLSTLELQGVPPTSPKPNFRKRLRRRASADTDIIKIDGGSSAEGSLELRILVPEGYHFSKEAVSKFDAETEHSDAITFETSSGIIDADGSASLRFMRSSPSPETCRINCKIYYCKEDEVCLYQTLAFDVSFQPEASQSNPARIPLSYTIKPKIPVDKSPLMFAN